jgi:vacuolar-type H+-ATPase subunit C/Vma6
MQMQLFLSEVEGTSYGGVLRDINAFLHNGKDADDDFLRRQKDKAQKYIADSNDLSEKITSEWIGRLMEGLKTRIKYVGYVAFTHFPYTCVFPCI